MDLSVLDKKDTYSFLLSAVYASTANDNYALLSDLIYVLDQKSLKNFLSLFEGQTISVPSMLKLNKMLTAMMIFTYHDIDKIPLDIVLKQLNIPVTASGPQEYVELKRLIKEHKIEIGGLLDDFPSKASNVEG